MDMPPSKLNSKVAWVADDSPQRLQRHTHDAGGGAPRAAASDAPGTATSYRWRWGDAIEAATTYV